MNFTIVTVTLELALGVLFIIGSVSSLSCWVCSSDITPLCNDDWFPGEIPSRIFWRPCHLVPAIYGDSDDHRSRVIPATTCSKSVLKVNGKTKLVERSCASLGDTGIKDATKVGCDTIDAPNGKGEVTICLCDEDVCNASQNLMLTWTSMIGLTILSIGFINFIN